MDEIDSMDNVGEVMLPGFRFSPTDEELVGFYLQRKIQQKPFAIELIRQIDIYKYDPWDLPKLATASEKECYFYCQRDRKYRNSTRTNRVTRAGFWKATGADKPIYSTKGTDCIGLKKSLVFYKGRAANGVKTEWMMHEFRLPSLSDSSHKNIPTNDSWAICRIFKRTGPTTQRAWSQCVLSPTNTTASTNLFNIASSSVSTNFDFGNITCRPKGEYEIQFSCNSLQQQLVNLADCQSSPVPATSVEFQNCTIFSSIDLPIPSKFPMDVSCDLQNLLPEILGDYTAHASIDFGDQSSISF